MFADRFAFQLCPQAMLRHPFSCSHFFRSRCCCISQGVAATAFASSEATAVADASFEVSDVAAATAIAPVEAALVADASVEVVAVADASRKTDVAAVTSIASSEAALAANASVEVAAVAGASRKKLLQQKLLLPKPLLLQMHLAK